MHPLLLLVLAACGTPAEFTPAAFFVRGTFRYDAATDEAVAFVDQDVSVGPTLQVTVTSTRWRESFDEAERCAIVLVHEGAGGLPRAAWSDAAEPWFGFALPDTATATTDCTGWDPDLWGDDPSAVVSSWDWGLGVGPLDPEVEDELTATVVAQSGQETWDDVWAPAVFGGGFHWNGAADRDEGPYLPSDYAFALQVDEDGTLVRDWEGRAAALPASEVADGSLPDGVYTVEPWFGVDAALLLPTNL